MKLHAYAYKGDLEGVINKIENGIHVDLQENELDGMTALMVASLKGHLSIVEYLVEQGADVNFQDNYGDTALIKASEEGHLDIVKYLVENGADIHLKTHRGKSAIGLARRNDHPEIVEYLEEIEYAQEEVLDHLFETRGDIRLQKYIRSFYK